MAKARRRGTSRSSHRRDPRAKKPAKKAKRGRDARGRFIKAPIKKATEKAQGRPRKTFDLGAIEGLGAIMATQEEMAAVLRCSVDTIQDRLRTDDDFSGVYKKGQSTAKLSLRRAQKHKALGRPARAEELNEEGRVVRPAEEEIAPNPTMMIWLGKQWLDQRDRQDIVTTQQHEEFRSAYVRAGVDLVEGLRRGRDLEEVLQRFVATVRSLDERSETGAPGSRETTRDEGKKPSDVN